MSIRDHIATAHARLHGRAKLEFIDFEVADAILAACPEIAALDHAREGALVERRDPFGEMVWRVWSKPRPGEQIVLVIPTDRRWEE